MRFRDLVISTMRYVVTGAAGFLGSHLCEELLRLGHVVVGVDSFTHDYCPTIKARNQSVNLAQPHYHFQALDLCMDPLEAVIADADVVIHLAGWTTPFTPWSEFDAVWRANVLATHRLLEAVRLASHRLQRFVFGSSDSVYGLSASGNESQPTNPTTAEGVTKHTAEQTAKAYLESFAVPVVLLRYFDIIGSRQRPDSLVYHLIECGWNDSPLSLHDNEVSLLAPLHVLDAVAATIAAVNGPIGECYNVGGIEPVTCGELVQHLETLADRTLNLSYNSTQPTRHALADVSKLKRHVGWQPAISLRDALTMQCRWQSEQRTGWDGPAFDWNLPSDPRALTFPDSFGAAQ